MDIEVDYKKQYHWQLQKARSRDIDFLLSYNEWLTWWKNTGFLSQRGRKRGQYVMARFEDKGPYALDNIYCCKTEENLQFANKGSKNYFFGNNHKGENNPAFGKPKSEASNALRREKALFRCALYRQLAKEHNCTYREAMKLAIGKIKYDL